MLTNIFHFGPYKYWYDTDTRVHHVEEYDQNLPSIDQPPVFLQVGVTNRCNLKCSYCYANSSPRGKSSWTKNTLYQILSTAYQAGLTAVAFGGGEPFIEEWFLDLLEELANNTRLSLSVTSNGTLLNDNIARMLLEHDIQIRISVNSMAEYKQRRKGIELLLKQGVSIGLNSILSPQNDFLRSSELKTLLVLNPQLDVLLLRPQNIGRGNFDKQFSDDDIKRIVLLLGMYTQSHTIKVSSELLPVFQGVNNINWQFPPDLCQYPGFFGSIDARGYLKHTSFCNRLCGELVEHDMDETQFLHLWQKVTAKPCLRTTRLDTVS